LLHLCFAYSCSPISAASKRWSYKKETVNSIFCWVTSITFCISFLLCYKNAHFLIFYHSVFFFPFFRQWSFMYLISLIFGFSEICLFSGRFSNIPPTTKVIHVLW
jgi:hypothetical protein